MKFKGLTVGQAPLMELIVLYVPGVPTKAHPVIGIEVVFVEIGVPPRFQFEICHLFGVEVLFQKIVNPLEAFVYVGFPFKEPEGVNVS